MVRNVARPLHPLIRIPGRRSKLHAWFVLEWETLRGGTINWPWLMSEIAKRGLTDRNGQPPKLLTAQQTWYRVKAEMRERQKAVTPSSPPPKPIAPSTPVKSPPSRLPFAPPSAKDPPNGQADQRAVDRRSVSPK
jgi:hypothetical protein